MRFGLLAGLRRVALVGMLAASGSSLAQTCSQESFIYANTGIGDPSGFELIRYSPAGVPQASVPLLQAYGDIALTADGQTLYAMPIFDPGLYVVDLATGEEGARLALDLTAVSEVVFGSVFNGLSIVAGGELVMGVSTTSNVYRVNPQNGVTTLYASYPPVPAAVYNTIPVVFTTAGDFIQLDNGDVLALAAVANEADLAQTFKTALIRIRPDKSSVVVGALDSPNYFGMARQGDALFLFGYLGTIESLSLTTLPASGTGTLAPSPVVSTERGYYGAASSGDSGYLDCAMPIPVASPAALAGLALALAALACMRAGRLSRKRRGH